MKYFSLFLFLIFSSCSSRGEAEGLQNKSSEIIHNPQTEQNVNNPDANYFNFISSIKLPEQLSFCGENVPLNIPEVKERAEREFYLLLQQPGQIILYLKRAGRYFPMFRDIINKNGMHDDMVYLATAESALYMSRSSKDAVGLWQFIPSTAQKMGLIVNEFVDERRHPEKSTDAAMKYLKAGFNSHKSWFLAAAGYNMGHTNVSNHLEYQNTDDVFDLFMNEETSRYLLRIVIIKEIMSNSEKYGFILGVDDIYKPDKVKIIKVKSIDNLAGWAKSQGTTYKDVRLLNPWILAKKIPALRDGSDYEISIPDK